MAARTPFAAKRDYYPILDALRIVLAFWVVMAHFGVFPLFAWLDSGNPLGRLLVGGWSSMVAGVPAVIGFFVISGFCWMCLLLHFHAGVHFQQTMLWFGILAYWWLKREIAHSRAHQPVPVLVRAGAWSYSLYLMHFPCNMLFSRLQLPSLAPEADWLLLYTWILGLSYFFYLSVERPSHRLARKAGSSVTALQAGA